MPADHAGRVCENGTYPSVVMHAGQPVDAIALGGPIDGARLGGSDAEEFQVSMADRRSTGAYARSSGTSEASSTPTSVASSGALIRCR